MNVRIMQLPEAMFDERFGDSFFHGARLRGAIKTTITVTIITLLGAVGLRVPLTQNVLPVVACLCYHGGEHPRCSKWMGILALRPAKEFCRVSLGLV